MDKNLYLLSQKNLTVLDKAMILFSNSTDPWRVEHDVGKSDSWLHRVRCGQHLDHRLLLQMLRLSTVSSLPPHQSFLELWEGGDCRVRGQWRAGWRGGERWVVRNGEREELCGGG